MDEGQLWNTCVGECFIKHVRVCVCVYVCASVYDDVMNISVYSHL